MLNLDSIQGVIFDLDGTLVESSLDFKKMREDIGCPPQQDILAFVDEIACPNEKAQAESVILQHELEDAQEAKILPVGTRMLEQVTTSNLPMAIVTRNCRQATDMKIEMNKIAISLVLTREDAPAKPDPTALLHIAQQWRIKPENILYVGDYIYDQQAAENAGMKWHIL